LLSSVFAEAGVDSPGERLSLAAEISSSFGHGKIDLSQLDAGARAPELCGRVRELAA
jgi:hypothetical protein